MESASCLIVLVQKRNGILGSLGLVIPNILLGLIEMVGRLVDGVDVEELLHSGAQRVGAWPTGSQTA